jgi:hypothetical protein
MEKIFTASIEIGEPRNFVDDPDYWVKQSLEYLNRVSTLIRGGQKLLISN